MPTPLKVIVSPTRHEEIPDLRTRKMSCCKHIVRMIQRIQEFISRIITTITMGIVRCMKGILHRVRHLDRPTVEVSFPNLEDCGRPELEAKLKQFKDFEFYSPQEFECPAISSVQREAALKRYQELNTELNKTSAPFSNVTEETKAKYKEAQELRTLIETCKPPRSTRADFGRAEWKALDRINFALTKQQINTFAELVQEGVFAEQQKQVKVNFGISFYESKLAEILAKGLVYIEDLEGKEIQLPSFTEDGEVKFINYKIEQFFFGDELPGYVLEPTDGISSPWLIARGTSTVANVDEHKKELRIGSKESFKADIYDPNGLAEDAVIKAMVKTPKIKVNEIEIDGQSLIQRFKKWEEKGQKPLLAGHSLGGYLVNDLCVRFYKKIQRSYGFSSPGLSQSLGKRWDHKLKKESEKTGTEIEVLRTKSVNFPAEGDPVPAGGSYLIGLQLGIESDYGKRKLTPAEKHVHFNLNKGFKLVKIHVEKENARKSRRLAESIRAGLGRIIRFSHVKFARKEVPDWWNSRHANRKLYEVYKQEKRDYKAARTA